MAADSIEIEAKFPVADLAAVRQRLRAVGASHVGRVLECNRFFDRGDAELRAAGCGLRVRSVRVLDGPAVAATMTFKGPVQAGAFKARRECEFAVSDADRAAELLTSLGFNETFLFEKRRESWRLGGCAVELDELPRVGSFVEIEGPDEAAIRDVQGQLALGGVICVRESYLALIVRHCEQTGISARVVRMADSDGTCA